MLLPHSTHLPRAHAPTIFAHISSAQKAFAPFHQVLSYKTQLIKSVTHTERFHLLSQMLLTLLTFSPFSLSDKSYNIQLPVSSDNLRFLEGPDTEPSVGHKDLFNLSQIKFNQYLIQNNTAFAAFSLAWCYHTQEHVWFRGRITWLSSSQWPAQSLKEQVSSHTQTSRCQQFLWSLFIARTYSG